MLHCNANTKLTLLAEIECVVGSSCEGSNT